MAPYSYKCTKYVASSYIEQKKFGPNNYSNPRVKYTYSMCIEGTDVERRNGELWYIPVKTTCGY